MIFPVRWIFAEPAAIGGLFHGCNKCHGGSVERRKPGRISVIMLPYVSGFSGVFGPCILQDYWRFAMRRIAISAFEAGTSPIGPDASPATFRRSNALGLPPTVQKKTQTGARRLPIQLIQEGSN
jgi:hypothetical protein